MKKSARLIRSCFCSSTSKWLFVCKKRGRSLLFLFFLFTRFTVLLAQADSSLILPEALIVSKRYQQTGYREQVLDSLPIGSGISLAQRLQWENLADIRANAPGTLATVSIRGAGPSKTPVYWNGMNLQSTMNGVVDLSLLPNWQSDRISLRYGGQSAGLGAGSMSGAVLIEANLLQEQNGLHFSGNLSAGSFGFHSLTSQIQYSQDKYSTEARVSMQQAENNFPFINTSLVGKPRQKQLNNQTQLFDIQQFNKIKISSRNTIRTAFWHQRADRNIPPAMTESFRETGQRDRATRATVQWIFKQHHKNKWVTQANWRDEHILYRLASDTDSSHAQGAQLGTYYGYTAQNFAFQTGTDLAHDQAQSDGYADSSATYRQERLAGYASAEKTFGKISLVAQLRQEWVTQQQAPLTWSVGGLWPWGAAGKLRWHASRNFNLPTFNDRFWQALGNTSLRAEKGYSFDLGWQLHKKWLDADLAVFHILMDDWILWQPGTDGIFRPGNLRKVWSRGINAGIKAQVHQQNWRLSIKSAYQYNPVTNVAVYGGNTAVLDKQLPYTPIHTASMGLQAQYSGFSGVYLHQFTGQRFASSDNSNPVKGFQHANCWLAYQFNLKTYNLRIEAGIQNCWNTRYQVIAYRPMPGRSFRLGVTISN